MPGTTTPGDALEHEVAHHHSSYAPVYDGYLSDHGPMAALALAGIGGATDRTLAWLQRYRERLDPVTAAPPGYRQCLEAMLEAVARLGAGALLERELPTLISGWAKHAYHPLIRTAYGYEFGIPEEVAAGLAYLAWLGPDTAIAETARHVRRATDADSPFLAMKACATRVSPARRFDDCLTRVTSRSAFRQAAVGLDDPLRTYSLRALSVFAATGDFFALHLVTGAHAFRILYDFAGSGRDAIFALGLLAGYASVGAPDYPALPPAQANVPPDADWLRVVGNDEHRIKLAFSASSQSTWFGDARYVRVAADYLGGG